MTTKTRTILESLRGDEFPYPVAIHPGCDFDLGPVISADALDVPSDRVLDVADHLSDLLWPVETMTPVDVEPVLLTSAHGRAESAAKRATLPDGTVWYRPRDTRRQQR